MIEDRQYLILPQTIICVSIVSSVITSSKQNADKFQIYLKIINSAALCNFGYRNEFGTI